MTIIAATLLAAFFFCAGFITCAILTGGRR